jgi:hypothetical protein
MGLIFKDADKPVDAKSSRLYAALFNLVIGVLALIGLAALLLLVHDEVGSGFRMPRQMASGLLSAAIVCGGLIVLLLGIRAKKEAIKAAAMKKDWDDKPWLQRQDWANGRIVSSLRKASWLLWIVVGFWCVGSIAISLAALPQLQSANHTILLALVLVVGLAAIIFASRTSSAWRRFGWSIFEMTAVPAAAGGVLQGKIQVRGKLQPHHGWNLLLLCVRRKTTGQTNNLQITEKILWQDERWLQAALPQKDADTTVIPVYFRLPDDKPESTVAGDGVHWRLEAWARVPGPNFHVAFEVPVFKVDDPPPIPEDPTTPWHVSLDDIRQKIQSPIQIKDVAGGKEFIFPSGRTPGFAMGAALLCLIWAGIVALLAMNHAPPLLPLIFGAMDVLMLVFVLDLSFRRSHVIIAGQQVKLEKAWLGYKKAEAVNLAEIADFYAEPGAPVGHVTYYDLKLRTRAGKELTLAKNLGHKPEADWLARQMTTTARALETQTREN